MEQSLEARIQELEKLTAAQTSKGNWDCNWYMMGLANGLLLALHTIRGDEGDVPYKSKPDEWLDDRYERLIASGWQPMPTQSEEPQ